MPESVPTIVVKAESAAPAPTNTASNRDKAIAMLKDSVDAPDAVVDHAGQVEPAATATPAKKPASEIAAVARAHRQLLKQQQELKTERAQLDADKADAELGKKLRSGELGALDTIDPEWYTKATKHTIAKMKPGAPEVLIDQLTSKIEALGKQIESIKNPPPPPPPDPAIMKQVETRFNSTVAEAVKANSTLELLAAEDPVEVAKEVTTYCTALAQSRGLNVTTWEQARSLIDEAAVEFEAVLRARRDLTSKVDASKTQSGTANSGTSRQVQPQAASRTQPKTMSTSLNGGVSVSSAPKTYEERKAAAMAELRRAREAE